MPQLPLHGCNMFALEVEPVRSYIAAGADPFFNQTFTGYFSPRGQSLMYCIDYFDVEIVSLNA